MSFHHHAFGLHIWSNVPIEDLPAAPPKFPCQLAVHLGEWPEWCQGVSLDTLPLVSQETNARIDFRKHYWLNAPDGTVSQIFAYPDGCQFLVNSTGTEVWSRWPEGYFVADAITYLLGSVIGLAFYLRGALTLHASAFLQGDGAVLFLGQGGAGKSSTVASLARRGRRVITEDMSLVEERADDFWVTPGYPRIRLWPEGVETVLGPGAQAPRLTPTWDKCYLSIGDSFHDRPVPIRRMYILLPRILAEGLEKPLPLRVPEAFQALLSNLYFPIPHKSPSLPRHLAVLNRMARTGMVRTVAALDDPQRLPEFIDLILADCADLLPQRPAE